MPGGDYLDETHQRISEFAEDFLEEDERDDFVDGLLERIGYQRTQHWAPPDPQGQQGGRKPLLKQGQQRRPQQRGGGQAQGQQGQQQGQRSYFGRK